MLLVKYKVLRMCLVKWLGHRIVRISTSEMGGFNSSLVLGAYKSGIKRNLFL